MKKIVYFVSIALGLGLALNVEAQDSPKHYLARLHSHNDYNRINPFSTAYGLGFGSVEVDLFLKDGQLYVAHDYEDIKPDRTFDSMYLQPILQAFKKSQDGYLYPNAGQLQLLIDPKTDGAAVLKVLNTKLKPYRNLFDSKNNPKAVKLVISGNRPSADKFDQYDEVFLFDGELGESYTTAQLERIGLFSAPFSKFSDWNGLGRLTTLDSSKIKTSIDSVHALGKKIRFWGTPDTKTTWYEWVKMGIDYINTDKPMESAEFLRNYHKTHVKNENFHSPYSPKMTRKSMLGKPKNVVLLISDGAGMAQLWAAAMANKGQLNVLNMPYTGYLVTSSTDNYHTDSAAGGSALATGVKTRNRHIGVDEYGVAVANIPDMVSKHGIVSGIVSNDQVTGATPSAFYAHVSERNNTDSIAAQIASSNLALIIGAPDQVLSKSDSAFIHKFRKEGVEVFTDANKVRGFTGDRLLVLDQDRVDREWNKLNDDQNSIKTSYRLIEEVFSPSVDYLQKRRSKRGFFLMVEGAKIDGGGHSNSLPFSVGEYLSFDRMVGQALQFADTNKETLVIVTSDHETGGLVLLDADRKNGVVLGNFATNDHTGIPVPVMSYGPGAELFQGFMDNTEIAKKIYKLLQVSK